ncbi:major facilitator superfamily permease [Levilactobacillus koreensis JCM 16448]|uniref:MFS transporter permease n=1 Tax=Levilactobacillus koreensis TaxID=637971 RepID=A0AAC8UVF4_9LACO|nr:MFS transporter [Levilactobacillus koreensis]AKP65241.1 MFS transporter permease [Levilactobacillus koreensis]KRK86175.1 major facilitator superfamily permease [Levilactobacillus koreensis JCM 16448]
MQQTTKAFNLPLLLAPFISRLGSTLYLFGLNWFVVQATGNAALLGVIQAIGGVVLFFGDLLCGVVVDNFNRKRIVVSAELLSVLGCLACAWWLDPLHITAAPLITLTVILDVGLAFSLPAAKAMIPELITLAGRQRFNAVSNTLIDLADICAPLIGGGLLALHWLNLQGFLLLNGTSFLLSFLLYLSIRYQKPTGEASQLGVKESLLTGWHYVWQRPKLVEAIVLGGLINVLYAAVRLVLPYDVNHLYGGDSAKYSYLLVMLALGGILGGARLTLARREPNRQQNYADLALAAGALLVAGLWADYWVLLVASGLFGFCYSCFEIRAITITQNLTAPDYLGRMFGILFLAIDAFQPLGSFIFGFVTDWVANWTLVIIGSLLVLGLALINHWYQRLIR